jgi:hypothetical protein
MQGTFNLRIHQKTLYVSLNNIHPHRNCPCVFQKGDEASGFCPGANRFESRPEKIIVTNFFVYFLSSSRRIPRNYLENIYYFF